MDDRWAADADEMTAVARGDDVAFTRLYRSHHPRVFRVACGILGDREAARDVAHDAFLKLLAVAPRWEPRARVDTWLHKVTVNACLSWRRRLVRALVPMPVAEAKSAVDVVADREAREQTRRALAHLSARDRALVVLHLDQDLAAHEIAPLVGLTDNAARVALHRALERVRRHLPGEASSGAAAADPRRVLP